MVAECARGQAPFRAMLLAAPRPCPPHERALAGSGSRTNRKAHFGRGMMGVMTLAYLVQHGEKEPLPGDPGLTETGQQQATRTGRWLRGVGVRGLWTSPMRRARETAERIAPITGLTVQLDAMLRERLNWDGSVSFDAFLVSWARTMQDRDWVPANGESSRQAGTR